MDGCQPLIAAARKSGFNVQGDGWHWGKNRDKHFTGHVDAYCPREQLSDLERSARKADKVARPQQPLGKTPSKLGKPEAQPAATLEQMRAALEGAGEACPGGTSAPELKELKALHAAAEAELWARACFQQLKAQLPPRQANLPLPAYVKYLGSIFSIRARQAVMTTAEKKRWAEHDKYCVLQADADAARAARAARNKELKRARLAAREWNRNLRSVYFFLFKYTASLRGVRRADGQLWTDEQRTAEAQRLYPLAALNLMAGRVDDDALQTISHPAAKLKESEWSWAPPESAPPPSQPPACPASHATLPASTSTSSGGFVKVRGLVWEILESWVRDPRCLDKFGFFIDNRSTACAAQPTYLLLLTSYLLLLTTYYLLCCEATSYRVRMHASTHVPVLRMRNCPATRHPARRAMLTAPYPPTSGTARLSCPRS